MPARALPGGYWGRLLVVDLSARTVRAEGLPQHVLHERVGGYGLGAHLLLQRMSAGTPPLAPASLLGFFPGPLTGTSTPTGSRFTVVGKSPLTRAWGDANCGGYFGPALKMAGYDGLLIGGQAERPVYLLVTEMESRLVDAAELWGLDTVQTEERLRRTHGPDARVACIGPAGEALSRTAAIISEEGRAAGRSGLGALMGSKRLKAVVASGRRAVPVSDPERLLEVRRACLRAMNEGFGATAFLRVTGTPGYAQAAVLNGDAPIKNWTGTAEDFPDSAALDAVLLTARRRQRYACYRCPLGCGGLWSLPSAEGDGLVHQPEYETIAAFGPLCLNGDVDSIARANDLCNRYGLDTIATGAGVAFTLSAYEEGLLGSRDLDGLHLAWGDGPAIVRLTEMIARREAWGAILADGLEAAVAALGPASAEMAVHVGGAALPMHDPRFEPGLAVIYALDPTPARHTQANQMEVPAGFDGQALPRDVVHGRGQLASRLSCLIHTVNSSGLCLFGLGCMTVQDFAAFMAAVTGWERSPSELETLGKGIADLRYAFNEREGIYPTTKDFPGRALGSPPASSGPWRGMTVDLEPMAGEYLQAMGWKTEEP